LNLGRILARYDLDLDPHGSKAIRALGRHNPDLIVIFANLFDVGVLDRLTPATHSDLVLNTGHTTGF
jgi:hypothetical protein